MAETKAQVDLVVNQSGNAPRAMRDVARATTEASKAQRGYGEEAGRAAKAATEGERRLQQELKRTQAELQKMGRTAASSSRAAGVGSSNFVSGVARNFGAASGISQFAGPMALAAVAMKANQALDTARAASQDAYLTDAQRQGKIVESMVPGSGTVRQAAELFTGTTREMGKAAKEFTEELAKLAGAMEKARLQSEYDYRRASAQAGVTALGANPYEPISAFDRSTAHGQQLYAEDRQRRPGIDALTRAQREVDQARSALDYQRGLVTKSTLTQQIEEAQKRYAQGEGKFGAGQSTADKGKWWTFGMGYYRPVSAKDSQAGANQMLLESNRLLELQRQKKEELLRLDQAQASYNEKSSAGRKAEIGIMQTELEILRQREQLRAGSAGRLGMMHTGQQVMGVHSAQFISKYGWDAASPELRSMLAGISPEAARMKAERSGEGSAAMRAMEALARNDPDFRPEFGAGALKDLRSQQQRLAVDIQQKVFIDEEQLAKNLTARLKSTENSLVEVIKAMIDEKLRNIKAGEIQRRASE